MSTHYMYAVIFVVAEMIVVSIITWLLCARKYSISTEENSSYLKLLKLYPRAGSILLGETVMHLFTGISIIHVFICNYMTETICLTAGYDYLYDCDDKLWGMPGK